MAFPRIGNSLLHFISHALSKKTVEQSQAPEEQKTIAGGKRSPRQQWIEKIRARGEKPAL
jgi:hypothetical protein